MSAEPTKTLPAAGFSTATMPLIVLWLLLSAVLLLTMPRFIYVGDPVSIRATTVSLLTRGRWDVPDEVAGRFGERGQYFHQHPTNGRWYSKYGVLNTLLFAPPLLVEQVWNGSLPYYHDLPAEAQLRRCLLLNLWNILVTLLLAGYLFGLARRFSATPWGAVLYVLAAILGTFLWYYARAQTVEIFQVTLFVMAFYHLLRACEPGAGQEAASSPPAEGPPAEGPPAESPPAEGVRTSVPHAAAAVGLLGLLSLSKLVYLPLLPIAAAFLLGRTLVAERTCGGTESGRSWMAALIQAARQQAHLLAAVGVTACLIAGLILVANWCRFGSPFSNGYQQFEREEVLFRFGWEGFYGYLADPRKSILLYFPLLPLSLVGIFRIPRQHRAVYACAWCGFLVLYGLNACFVNWRGDWCYGPRYLLFALPVLSLPVAGLLGTGRFGGMGQGLLTAAVLVFALMTVNAPLSIHGMEYFAAFRAERPFEAAESPAVRNYFAAPHWVVNRDLRLFRMGRAPFPPLDTLRGQMSDAQYGQTASSLQQVPLGNFYWLTVLGPAAERSETVAGPAGNPRR